MPCQERFRYLTWVFIRFQTGSDRPSRNPVAMVAKQAVPRFRNASMKRCRKPSAKVCVTWSWKHTDTRSQSCHERPCNTEQERGLLQQGATMKTERTLQALQSLSAITFRQHFAFTLPTMSDCVSGRGLCLSQFLSQNGWNRW